MRLQHRKHPLPLFLLFLNTRSTLFPSYQQVLSHFDPNMLLDLDQRPPSPVPIIGFSATFSRHDGLALGAVFDRIVYHRDFLEMIKEQWCVAYRDLARSHTASKAFYRPLHNRPSPARSDRRHPERALWRLQPDEPRSRRQYRHDQPPRVADVDRPRLCVLAG